MKTKYILVSAIVIVTILTLSFSGVSKRVNEEPSVKSESSFSEPAGGFVSERI